MSQDDDDDDDGGGGGGETFWESLPSSKEMILPLGIAAGAILIATAPLWYLALMFLLAPLMVRLRKGKTDKRWRDRIYAAVVSRPGVHFNGLKGWLDISNGTLIYNLELLISEGKITAKRDGFFKRYYPAEAVMRKRIPDYLSTEDRIAIVIRDNPGAAQSEIGHLLDEPRQKVHYHVKSMVRRGIVDEEEGHDGHPRYYIAEGEEGRRKLDEIYDRDLLSPEEEARGRPAGEEEYDGGIDTY
jgi:predicted transcriptional regulator